MPKESEVRVFKSGDYNVRIFVLAADLRVTRKEVLTAAKLLGISANSHASSITRIDADQIKKHFKQQLKKLGQKETQGNLTKKQENLNKNQRRLKRLEAERSQKRKKRQELLEERRQQQRSQAQNTRELATASAPRAMAPDAQKLIGSDLVSHCLQGLAEGVAETSICIRAGYKVDEIGQFRRAFSKATKVDLAPLSRMASELKQTDAAESHPLISAIADRQLRTVTTSARVRDAGFRSAVLASHGSKCVCCGIAIPDLLEAAHIVPVADNGSDSPANGLPLCPTHHSAFDRHLFGINPVTLEIQLARGLTAEMLQIQQSELKLEVSQEALRMRWDIFQAEELSEPG